jgi:hypothetical protein
MDDETNTDTGQWDDEQWLEVALLDHELPREDDPP